MPLRCHCSPNSQQVGSQANMCSFCRKHNARTFSDPKAHVKLTAANPQQIQVYSFGLKTSYHIMQCGVYVPVIMTDGSQV